MHPPPAPLHQSNSNPLRHGPLHNAGMAAPPMSGVESYPLLQRPAFLQILLRDPPALQRPVLDSTVDLFTRTGPSPDEAQHDGVRVSDLEEHFPTTLWRPSLPPLERSSTRLDVRCTMTPTPNTKSHGRFAFPRFRYEYKCFPQTFSSRSNALLNIPLPISDIPVSPPPLPKGLPYEALVLCLAPGPPPRTLTPNKNEINHKVAFLHLKYLR